MDEMQAFEQQVAGAFVDRAGPVQAVDAAAIFAGVRTRPSQGWGFGSLYAVSRLLVAGLVVAVFGGFLLQGVLLAPHEDSAPAMPSASYSPEATDGQAPLAFPTGTFASESGDTLVFREDGTCDRSGIPCTFGVLGDRFAETTFEDPSARQVPATYAWQFDGEELIFESWGTDLDAARSETYESHVYRPVGETQALPSMGTDFPTGNFMPNDGNQERIGFDGSRFFGTGSGGTYVVNQDLITFMTAKSVLADVAQVPATYHWAWDGEQLTFRPWGEDVDPWRRGIIRGRIFVRSDGDFSAQPRTLLLSSPRLEYFVTVEIQERDDGRYQATASIDEEPLGEGVGGTQQEAVRAALEPLGEPHASELSEGVTG